MDRGSVYMYTKPIYIQLIRLLSAISYYMGLPRDLYCQTGKYNLILCQYEL